MTHSLDDALVEKVARALHAEMLDMEAGRGGCDWNELSKEQHATLDCLARAALEAAGVAEFREDMVERLWIATRHGDDEHRAWLREAFTAFFAGKPIPEPRGKGRKEAMVAELREALRHIHLGPRRS